MNPDEVKSTIRSLLIYKYVFLILSLVVMGLLLFNDGSDEGVNWGEIIKSSFGSIAVAVLISLVIDLFVRRQIELERQIDVEERAVALSKSIFGLYGPSVIPSDQVPSFVDEILANEDVVDAMCARVSQDARVARAVKRSVFDPITTGEIFEAKSVDHKLSKIEGDTDRYNWEQNVEFDLPSTQKFYRCIIVSDNDIGALINSMKEDCDDLIFVAPNEPGKTLLYKSEITLLREDLQSGERHEKAIAYLDVTAEKLSSNPMWSEDWLEKIAILEFPLPDDTNTNHLFRCRFQTRLRYQDPFFYWKSDKPQILRKFRLSYPGLVEEFGRISLIPLFGSNSAKTQIDRINGEVEVSVDSIVWPGQGVVAIWRGQSTDPNKMA